jgi:Zn finger protein HypA/HybF involved in hydrogenase expression
MSVPNKGDKTMEIQCSECKETWEVGTFNPKEYRNRCPYCGNHYLKLRKGEIEWNVEK